MTDTSLDALSEGGVTESPPPVWRPSQDRVTRSALTAFGTFVKDRFPEVEVSTYEALHPWSITATNDFWRCIWDHCEVIASEPSDVVVRDADKMPGASWFPDARLNFAENLLRRRGNATALVSLLENGTRNEITFDELYAQVAAISAALKARGIKPGDRVAGFMPNITETVVAMLAATSLGAVWTSCSPDFGFQGVMDRFGQVKPKVLFTADGYYYNGKAHDSLQKVRQIATEIDSLEQVVIVEVVEKAPNIAGIEGAALFSDWQLEHAGVTDIGFEQLPFDHPLYIMYSSGTTGVPKCIMHGAGGTLIQHLKEHQLHCDIRPEDTLFYFTTCGWMMWNWLVSGLASGATLVLYDGSPFADEGRVLLDAIDRERIRSLAPAPSSYRHRKAGLSLAVARSFEPQEYFVDGSPLSHESFEYVYRDFKTDVLLARLRAVPTSFLALLVVARRALHTGQINAERWEWRSSFGVKRAHLYRAAKRIGL